MKNQISTLSGLILTCVISLLSCTKETVIEPENSISTWYGLNKNPASLEVVQWDKMITLQLSDNSLAYSVPVRDSANIKELIFFIDAGKQEAVYKIYSPLKNGLELKVYSISGILLKNGIISRPPSKKSTISFREMRNDIEVGTMLNEVIVTAPRLNASDWSTWTYVHYGGSGDYSQVYHPYFGGGGGGGGNPSLLNFSDYNYSRITNNLTNPCFIQVLEELQAGNAYGLIKKMISDFGKDDSNLNFTINEVNEEPKIDIYQNEDSYFAQTNATIISLNLATMKNASKEFIAYAIIHEMIHVYLHKTELDDHQDIGTIYLDPIVNTLIKLYKMDPANAKLLAQSGTLGSPYYYNTIFFNPQLREKISTVVNKYNSTNIHKYGTYCNN